MPCPACGAAEPLDSVAEHYDREVRKPDADPEALAPLAPPTRRASIHGFILAVLAWISLLVPFFASARAIWRDSVPFWVLTLLWIPLFRRARRQDAAALSAYRTLRRCPACGWTGVPK